MDAVLLQQETEPEESPASVLEELEEIVDRLLPPQLGCAAPVDLRSNLIDTGDSYVLQIAIPGADARTMRIEVTGHEVTVRGRYHLAGENNGSYIWRHLCSAAYRDVVDLPKDVTPDGAEADYRQGVLTIRLMKTGTFTSPTYIPVHVA